MTDKIYAIRVPIVVDAIYYSKAEDEEKALAQVKELVETDSLELEGRACFAYRDKESVDAEMFSTWEITPVPAGSITEINSYFFEPDDDYEDVTSDSYFEYIDENDYDEYDFLPEDWWYYE